MMNVTLNENQLAHLSHSISMKGVNYYDVNLEMTDHIASEVEEEMESSGLEFMKAVNKVFLRYSRFHFMNIEDEKTRKIQKQSWRQVKKGFLQFFTIPKVVITISLFIILQYLIENGFIEYIFSSFIFLAITISSRLFYLKRKWIGKENYLQLYKFYGSFSLLFQLIIQGMVQSPIYLPKNVNVTQLYLHTTYWTFVFLMFFVLFEIYTNELKLLRLQNA